MSRRNIATIVCFAAVASLVLVAGCKKKKADGDKSSGSMTASVEGMKARPAPDQGRKAPMKGVQGGMAVKSPVKASIKGRVGALPIPADYPLVTIFLKALRGTALFTKYEAKLKGMLTSAMAEKKMLNSLVKECKLDFFGNVVSVSLSRSPTSKDPDHMAIIVVGTFDAPKLLTCMKGAMKAAKVEHTDVTIGGKKGYLIKMKSGKTVTALALGPKVFAMIGKAMMPKAKAVLEGKLGSIEDTPLFKGGLKKVKAKPATVLAAIVPTVPSVLLAKVNFPIAKKIRAAVVMVGLPGDGLEFQAGVDLGDSKMAKTAAKTLPPLLGIVKVKLGALGVKLLQNLKVTDDKTWVKVDLKLDKDTFGQLQGFVTKTLLKVMGGKGGHAGGAKSLHKPAPKGKK